MANNIHRLISHLAQHTTCMITTHIITLDFRQFSNLLVTDQCRLRSGDMESYLRAPPAAAPVVTVIPEPPPPGFVVGTLQPTDSVTSFCWILRRHNGSNVYRCKLCNHVFTGQKSVAITHFRSSYSSQRIKDCTGIISEVLRGNLNDLMAEKSQQSKKATTKRVYSTLGYGESIDKQLLGQCAPLADAAILRFLVSNGVSATVISSDSFKAMTRAISNAGSGYKAPRRQSLGVNRGRSTHPDGFGNILADELLRCRKEKLRLLQGTEKIGGTLASDGAKNMKCSVLNSVLQTSEGSFFAQSTDATGKFKNAEFLLDDIKSAIEKIGPENVFIVALDGACKVTLRLLWNDPTMHKVFPQRCSTHGLNLLLNDIGSFFKWEIAACVRLVKFVCNHDYVFSLLTGRFLLTFYLSLSILIFKAFLP